jgi:hypothetical protein
LFTDFYSSGEIEKEYQINYDDEGKRRFQTHKVEFDEKGNWTKMITTIGDRLIAEINRIIEYY